MTMTYEKEFAIGKEMLADDQAWQTLRDSMLADAHRKALEKISESQLKSRWGKFYKLDTNVKDVPDLEMWKFELVYEYYPQS